MTDPAIMRSACGSSTSARPYLASPFVYGEIATGWLNSCAGRKQDRNRRKQVSRDSATGRFRPGQSGNPHGRPPNATKAAVLADLRAMSKDEARELMA
jgi:hypothetical protein